MDGVSVIIPVYNVENHLRRCINSVLAQTRPPIQIILIDDGSADKSGAICDEYQRKHPSVIALHQVNQGISAARNAGIDIAAGEYISFVDSDDYLEPAMYEELIDLMDTHTADIGIGGIWIEKENGEKYTAHADIVELCWSNTEALIELNSYRYFNMSFCDKIFKIKRFKELRFPVGKLCEDYYLMHQVISGANRIAYTTVPYYHYIQRPNSISRGKQINLAPMDASLAQVAFFARFYPELLYVAQAACAFSHMGIYTAFIRNDVKCPIALRKHVRKVARNFLGVVLKNPHLPKIKKLQAVAFCTCLPLYQSVVKRKEHR